MVQLALVLFFAPLFAASRVAQEKDRQTLVLLLMTDLRDRELVIGKLLASLLPVGMLLAASAPVFALVTVAGGRFAGADRLVAGDLCGDRAGRGKLGIAGRLLARKDVSNAGDQRAGAGPVPGHRRSRRVDAAGKRTRRGDAGWAGATRSAGCCWCSIRWPPHPDLQSRHRSGPAVRRCHVPLGARGQCRRRAAAARLESVADVHRSAEGNRGGRCRRRGRRRATSGRNPIIWREICTKAYGRKMVFIKLAFFVLFLFAAAYVHSNRAQRRPSWSWG